jgi:HlyD family secretion protein
MKEQNHRTRNRWVGLIVSGLLVVGLLALMFRPQPIEVEVAGIERGDLVLSVVEDGRTRIRDRYTVSAPLRGVLQRPTLEEGDPIEKEQVVARIFPALEPLLDRRSRQEAEARVAGAQAAVKRAEAAVKRAVSAADLARTNLERSRELVRTQVLSASEFDRMEAEFETSTADLEAARFGARVAQHELSVAKASLQRASGSGHEEFVLRAPVNGVVLEVYEESETAIGLGAPILAIGDPAHMEVVVDVLTRDAVRIEPGAEAFIDRWGGGERLAGRVHRVEPAAFTEVSALGVEEQRVNVILDLTAPRSSWSMLGDGFRVEAEIVLRRVDDVLLIPAAALFRAQGDWAAFQVLDGRARRVGLELGASNDRHAELRSGLAADDKVIVYPNDLVDDGVSVKATASD